MRFDILTIFPQFLDSPLQEGIIRRAVAAGKIRVNIHDIRDFAQDKHAMTDDRPFGGGEGMVMKPEPIARALRAVQEKYSAVGSFFFLPRGRLIPRKQRKGLQPMNTSSCCAAGMKEWMRESGKTMFMKRSPSGIIS